MILLGVVLAGCSSELQQPELLSNPSAVSFRAVGVSATRTSFDEQTLSVDWAMGDKVAVWAEQEGNMALRAVEFTATEADASGAKFEAFLTQMERGEYTYYSTYPTPSKVAGSVTEFSVPSVQAGEYDCALDVLMAEPATALALTQKGANLNLRYQHALHALRIEIPDGMDNYGNTVESIELEFPSEIAGVLSLDIKGEQATTVKGTNRITVNCNARMSRDGVAWVFIAPTDITDQEFTLTINSVGKSTSFNVAGRNFRAGYLSNVVVAMPEVLILQSPRTLIDNNEGRVVTDPAAATLSVELRGAESSSIVRGGVEYTTPDGATITKECRYQLGSQTFDLSVDGLATGLYSMRAFVELMNGETLYSEWAEGMRVVGNITVNLGEVNTSYTYYTKQGASVANSKSGTSIYTSENRFSLDSSFVSEVDEVGVAIDGVNYPGIVAGTTFNMGEIANQSWARHSIVAYVVVNGVRFESAAYDVDVTGIPYSVSTKSSSLPEGWSGDKIVWQGSGWGVGDVEKCLRLKAGSKTNQASNGWVVSPAFHIPSSLGVTTTVSNYLYRAVNSTKATIYAAASSGSYSTDTAGGVRKSGSVEFCVSAGFDNDQFSFTLSSSKPRVTVYANDFSQTTDTWFTVKSISVQYK